MRASPWPLLVIALVASACAARGFVPPAPTGKALPDDLAVWGRMGPCLEIRSLTAEASLSGRIEGQRVRARLHMGLARGDGPSGGVRIEGVAPFGGPIFTLAGSGGHASLVLPREGRGVSLAPTRDLLGAIAGVPLDHEDLLSMATGCLGYKDAVASGAPDLPVQRVAGGLLWARTLEHKIDVWFDARRGPAPSGSRAPPVVAARQGDLLVEYPGRTDAWPRVFRVRRLAPTGNAIADLTLTMSQVEYNVALPDAAFTIDMPRDAAPMTIDELRRTGPFSAR